MIVIIIIIVALGFEFRTSCLLDRYFIPWATPATPVLWFFWPQGLGFCPEWLGPLSYYFKLFVFWDDWSAATCQFFPFEKGSLKLFCSGLPGTPILPMSTSQVARITCGPPAPGLFLFNFILISQIFGDQWYIKTKKQIEVPNSQRISFIHCQNGTRTIKKCFVYFPVLLCYCKKE
jgi:hypothetical protein